jgi:GH18 family chitinase
MDTTAKKILSFGGWSFSTDHDTSPIFATGVSDANRELFATNVVQFLKDNKLDGLDFDWEVSFSRTRCMRRTDFVPSIRVLPTLKARFLALLQTA